MQRRSSLFREAHRILIGGISLEWPARTLCRPHSQPISSGIGINSITRRAVPFRSPLQAASRDSKKSAPARREDKRKEEKQREPAYFAGSLAYSR